MVGLVPPYSSDDDRSEGNESTDLHTTGTLITRALERQGPCTLDALASRLPTCTWNQIFMAVDALSREGTISLQPCAHCQYLVSLVSVRTHALRRVDLDRPVADTRQRTGDPFGE